MNTAAERDMVSGAVASQVELTGGGPPFGRVVVGRGEPPGSAIARLADEVEQVDLIVEGQLDRGAAIAGRRGQGESRGDERSGTGE